MLFTPVADQYVNKSSYPAVNFCLNVDSSFVAYAANFYLVASKTFFTGLAPKVLVLSYFSLIGRGIVCCEFSLG